MSNKKITNAQIKLISYGLKFLPVKKLNKNRIRRQLPQDFEIFARQMRHTNIPQEEGIEIACTAYDNFHKNNTLIPTKYLREILRLILKENPFQFNGRHYLQTHGTAMGTKTAVSFANIFMAKIETEILRKVVLKPTVCKRYIDDVFSLWDISKPDIETFIEQANLHHPTIKFTAEISDTETMFLDTIVCKGMGFNDQSILDVKTHFKPTETFQYTHFTSSPARREKQIRQR